MRDDKMPGPGRCDRHCESRPHRSAWEPEWSSPVERMIPGTFPHYCTRLVLPQHPVDFTYSTSHAQHVPPSPHHVLVLQTAPRRSPTLDATRRALSWAGISEWQGAKICASDGPHVPFDESNPTNQAGWHHVAISMQRGGARAFVLALRLALAVDPDLELMTFIEDDVELCKNALHVVARTQIPREVAFLTWFTYDYDWSTPRHSLAFIHPAEEARTCGPLLASRPSRYFILTQLITLPRRTVERILSCPRASRDWPRLDGHDELIAWALGDARYAAHFPILAQHAAGDDNSAISFCRGSSSAGTAQAGARTSPHYVGHDFDALSLLAPR